MKNKNIAAEQAWRDFEDLLAPQLSFSLSDRAVYSHLFRHSRLERKLQFQFSIPWLAHGVGVSSKTARDAVRRLIARGVLHLVERNTQAHHVVRLRLPSEVRAVRGANIAAYRPAPAPCAAVNLEEEDFLRTRPLRQAIHAREDGRSKKGERSAQEFFRSLYREHRLSDAELTGRLRALDDLAAGKLIPLLPVQRKNGNGS